MLLSLSQDELFVSKFLSTIWNKSEQQLNRGKLGSTFSKWKPARNALQGLHQNIKNFKRKQKDVEAT